MLTSSLALITSTPLAHVGDNLVATFGRGAHVALNAMPVRQGVPETLGLALFVECHAEAVKGSGTQIDRTIASYSYFIYQGRSDALSREYPKAAELFAFHYRVGEERDEGFQGPHLHVNGATGGQTWIPKLHVPTGLLAIEDLVRFLIEECGVVCERTREAWMATLRQNRIEGASIWPMTATLGKSEI